MPGILKEHRDAHIPDDRRLYGESYLADTLAVRLGGRAAERLTRGEASTGAAYDLASPTAGQGFQNFFVATPGLAPAASSRAGTVPAPGGLGY